MMAIYGSLSLYVSLFSFLICLTRLKSESKSAINIFGHAARLCVCSDDAENRLKRVSTLQQ